jgi:tRNA pseudouridine55 synthase
MSRRQPQPPPEFHGFLNVDKPPGMTSHDVVDAVRRVAGQRQVGHTGTLDPFATGVLVLALGKATRLAQHISGADKTYQGQITLGQETATYDSEGEVTGGGSVEHLDSEGIDAAMGLLRGAIKQVPPPYSAKKVAGKKLYEYARRGEKVEVEPKDVIVHQFALDRWEPPILHFRASVSSGTYVRSLAHDLGRALGCGGHLTQLARTQVGRFRLEDAVALADLERDPGLFADSLVPALQAMPEIPRITVTPEAARRLRNGSSAAIELRGIGMDAAQADQLFAVEESGALIALVDKVPSEPRLVTLQPRVQL